MIGQSDFARDVLIGSVARATRWFKPRVVGCRISRSRQALASTSSIRSTYSEIAANAALAIIAVACSLLHRQIAAQSKSFEKEGGFTERMYRVRTARRKSLATVR